MYFSAKIIGAYLCSNILETLYKKKLKLRNSNPTPKDELIFISMTVTISSSRALSNRCSVLK